MNSNSEHLQQVSLRLNTVQIGVIRQEHAILNQSDEQIASGVVVSYIERCLAKPHLDICSWAYVEALNDEDDVRLKLTLTEGQWRKIDEISDKKRISRAKLIRWIIADTAVAAGYPRG